MICGIFPDGGEYMLLKFGVEIFPVVVVQEFEGSIQIVQTSFPTTRLGGVWIGWISHEFVDCCSEGLIVPVSLVFVVLVSGVFIV